MWKPKWLAAWLELPQRVYDMESVVARMLHRQQIEDAARLAGYTVVGEFSNADSKDVKH